MEQKETSGFQAAMAAAFVAAASYRLTSASNLLPKCAILKSLAKLTSDVAAILRARAYCDCQTVKEICSVGFIGVRAIRGADAFSGGEYTDIADDLSVFLEAMDNMVLPTEPPSNWGKLMNETAYLYAEISHAAIWRMLKIAQGCADCPPGLQDELHAILENLEYIGHDSEWEPEEQEIVRLVYQAGEFISRALNYSISDVAAEFLNILKGACNLLLMLTPKELEAGSGDS